jgi:hypothetical protein
MIWVNMKGGGANPKVKSMKSLTSDLGKMTLDGTSTPPKKKKSPKVQAVTSNPPAADSKGTPPTKKPNFKGGDGKKGSDNKGKGGGGKRQMATKGKGRTKMATKNPKKPTLFAPGLRTPLIFRKMEIV